MGNYAFNGGVFSADVFEIADATVSFAIVEAKDVAAFSVYSIRFDFAVTEAKDIAAFTIGLTSTASFAITEPNDRAAFNLRLSLEFTFAVTDQTDFGKFRTFATFMGDGFYDYEAGYVRIASENRHVHVIPRLLKRDRVP